MKDFMGARESLPPLPSVQETATQIIQGEAIESSPAFPNLWSAR